MSTEKVDYNARAAKGQALNLAVAEAISKGKSDDNQFIMQCYVKYYKLSNLVQALSIEDIQQELK